MTATTKVILGICESCDGIADANDDKCHGCDKVICAFCMDMFEHQLDGAHGIGDPGEEVDRLRTVEQSLKNEYDTVRRRLRCSERRFVDAETARDEFKKQALAAQETIRAFCNYVAIAKPIEDGA